MFRRLTILFLAITIFLAASRVATAQVTVSDEPKALAVYAPQPAYPSEARDKHQTGRGIVLVNVDSFNWRRDVSPDAKEHGIQNS